MRRVSYVTAFFAIVLIVLAFVFLRSDKDFDNTAPTWEQTTEENFLTANLFVLGVFLLIVSIVGYCTSIKMSLNEEMKVSR